MAPLGDGNSDGKEAILVTLFPNEPYNMVSTITHNHYVKRQCTECSPFYMEELSVMTTTPTAASLTPEFPSQSTLLKKSRP